MPIAPNPNVIRVELRYDQDNQEVENTLFFETIGPATTADCENLALDVNGWWGAFVRPLQPTDVTLREVYARVMLNGEAPEGTSTDGLPDTGTKVGTALPNNVTHAISFRTGFSGRSRRGRNFIIGLVETDVTRNQVAAGVVTLWTAAYRELLPGAGNIPTAIWVVYSQYSNKVLRTTGLATPVNNVVFTNDVVDSQRRRLPGRGQ